MKPEHVALQVNQDDHGRSGEREGLPAWDRVGADVALGTAVGGAAKSCPIVGQSPQPAIRQAITDTGAYLRTGQHGAAERTTPAGSCSRRDGYGAFAADVVSQ